MVQEGTFANRLKKVLEQFCMESGARPGEFEVRVWYSPYADYYNAEIVWSYYDEMELSSRHPPVQRYLEKNFSEDELRRVFIVYENGTQEKIREDHMSFE